MRRAIKLAIKLAMANILASGAMAGACWGADRWGLDQVGPMLSSAGAIDFGPDGILLVGDAKQAAIVAINTGDNRAMEQVGNWQVDGINEKIAAAAGVDVSSVTINDIATNPVSGRVYLSAHIKDGTNISPQIWVAAGDQLSPLDVTKSSYATLAMPNAPADKTIGEGRRQRNARDESITGLTYTGGRVLVSGLSANDDPSSVWEFQFPFGETNSASSVEIYHAAHGRYEDEAAIRSFVTMEINGKPTLLAGYTCTPLVKLPLDELTPGEKVRATTVAELGNMNRPLDMLVYQKDGSSFVLMANSARGTMKISTANIEQNAGLTEPVKGGGTAGQEFEKIPSLDRVVKMDLYGSDQIVTLMKSDDNSFDLQIVDLP